MSLMSPNLPCHFASKAGFCEVLNVCRMRLTPMDISNIISIAAKLISNICSSFDEEKKTDLHCTDSSVGHVCCQKTGEEDNVKDSAILLIHTSVEILTEYLRLLRNACANCLDNQSAILT